MLEIRLLGELTIAREGRAATLPASKKTRALIAYLATTGRPQLREKLCELLWDGPDDPRAGLRWSLTKLRPLVDDDQTTRLVADRERVELVAGGAAIDLVAVRAAVPGGTAAGISRATTDALRGVAKYLRGDLLEGLDLPDCFRWDEWLRGEREATRRLGVTILGALIERVSATAPEEALGYARAKLSLEPLDEASHASVIRLLVELDRRTEAMAQYTSCSRLFERELGRGPSREIERLRITIGAQQVATPKPAAVIEPIAKPATPLFGRVQERGELEKFVTTDSDRVLFVLGDPGIGKTRLLDELALIAREHDVLVLRGRGVEAEVARPYGAWLDALGGETAFRSEADDRSRLFEAIRNSLTERAGDRGLIVIVDDIQWLDEASSALIHFIARSGGHAIRLACGARPGDLADNAAALRLVRSLTREQLAHQIGLSPLSPAETAQLAAAHAPGIDASRVFAESGGHPLFAVEIARGLARGDTAFASLDALIGERLELLEGAAREIVPWIAALGRAFTADVLGGITGLPLSDLSRAIEELERRAFVRAAGDEWDLAHDLVRSAAYARVSEPRRRLLHLQIARSLAALPDPNGELAVEVSHHAGLGGDSALCAEACHAAGMRCLRLFATDDATAHAMRGLAHASRLVGPVRARLQIDLLIVSIISDTRRQHREMNARELKRAIIDAQAAGCHAEAARGYNALSQIHYDVGDFASAATDSFDAARRAQDADPISKAQALAYSAQCLALLERDMPHVESLASEAAALLGSTGGDVAELPFALALVRHHQGDDDAALSLLERSMSLSEQRGVHWLVGFARSRAALTELARGHFAAARVHAQFLCDRAKQMGEGGDVCFGAFAVAIAGYGLGDHAIDFEPSLAALRIADAPALLAAGLSCLAEVDLSFGNIANAARHVEECLAAAERSHRPSEIAIAHALAARVATIEGARPRSPLTGPPSARWI